MNQLYQQCTVCRLLSGDSVREFATAHGLQQGRQLQAIPSQAAQMQAAQAPPARARVTANSPLAPGPATQSTEFVPVYNSHVGCNAPPCAVRLQAAGSAQMPVSPAAWEPSLRRPAMHLPPHLSLNATASHVPYAPGDRLGLGEVRVLEAQLPQVQQPLPHVDDAPEAQSGIQGSQQRGIAPAVAHESHDDVPPGLDAYPESAAAALHEGDSAQSPRPTASETHSTTNSERQQCGGVGTTASGAVCRQEWGSVHANAQPSSVDALQPHAQGRRAADQGHDAPMPQHVLSRQHSAVMPTAPAAAATSAARGDSGDVAASGVAVDADQSGILQASRQQVQETGRPGPHSASFQSPARKRACVCDSSETGTSVDQPILGCSSTEDMSQDDSLPSELDPMASGSDCAHDSASMPISDGDAACRRSRSASCKSTTVGAVCVDAAGRVAAGVSHRHPPPADSAGKAQQSPAAAYRCGVWAENARPGRHAVGASTVGNVSADSALAESCCRSASGADSIESQDQVQHSWLMGGGWAGGRPVCQICIVNRMPLSIGLLT